MLKIVNKIDTLISAFRTHDAELSLHELCRQTKLPKGTVYHILQSLKAIGWVVQEPTTKKYRLGLRLWSIAWRAGNQFGLSRVPRTYLQELAERTGETVHLSLIDPSEPRFVVYIDKIDSESPVRAYTYIGGTAPSHCVASGKAILAFNEPLFHELLSRRLEAYTQHSIVLPEALHAELEQIRKRRYSTNCEEYRLEVVGLACPIFNKEGNVFAALGISGPAYRLSLGRLEGMSPEVLRLAQLISRELGYLGCDV